MGSYFDPVRYDGPQPRRPLPRWLALCIAGILLFGLAVVEHQPIEQQFRKAKHMLAREAPPIRWKGETITPKPSVGAPLTWRVLGHIDHKQFMFADSVPGNFDRDADEELLLILNNMDQTESSAQVYEVDGSVRPAKSAAGTSADHAQSWDYDQNGIDEILMKAKTDAQLAAQKSNPPQDKIARAESEFPRGWGVFDLSGNRIAMLDNELGSTPIVGDFDGDGFKDMALLMGWKERGMKKAVVYGKDGHKAMDVELDEDFMPVGLMMTYGDIDGDGKVEIVGMDMDLNSNASALVAYGIGQPRQMILSSCPMFMPAAIPAPDIDGDGRVELLAFEPTEPKSVDLQITNPLTGKSTGVQLPKGFADHLQINMTPFNFDKHPGDEIACEYEKDDVVIFDSAGKLLYQAKVGEFPSLTRLHRGGQEYLIAVTHDKVLAYP